MTQVHSCSINWYFGVTLTAITANIGHIISPSKHYPDLIWSFSYITWNANCNYKLYHGNLQNCCKITALSLGQSSIHINTVYLTLLTRQWYSIDHNNMSYSIIVILLFIIIIIIIICYDYRYYYHLPLNLYHYWQCNTSILIVKI